MHKVKATIQCYKAQIIKSKDPQIITYGRFENTLIPYFSEKKNVEWVQKNLPAVASSTSSMNWLNWWKQEFECLKEMTQLTTISSQLRHFLEIFKLLFSPVESVHWAASSRGYNREFLLNSYHFSFLFIFTEEGGSEYPWNGRM